MKYKKVKLGEVCTMSSGGTPSRSKHEYYGGSILWAKISDIENAKTGIITETEEKITEQGLKAINNRIFETNTLLLAMYGSVGKTAITGCRLSTNQAILGIRPSKDDIISLHFLKFWLQYKKADLLNRAVGGTLQNISLGIVKNLEIPLPDLPTQRHIAQVLDKADALRQQNRQLLAFYDQLLQSTFIELFGDPVKNPKGWEVKSVIDCCESCIVPGRDKPKSFTGEIPWITTDDLVQLWITGKSKKNLGLLQKEIEEVRARKIPKNSVIMTCVGDLGVVSIAERDLIMNQQLHAFVCGDKIVNFFLAYVLSYQKGYMYKMASTTTVPYMNKTVCNSIPVILPPLPLQAHFAEVVAQIEVQKAQAGRSLAESEALFEGLLAGYFG